jgi:hypothetical protein
MSTNDNNNDQENVGKQDTNGVAETTGDHRQFDKPYYAKRKHPKE